MRKLRGNKLKKDDPIDDKMKRITIDSLGLFSKFGPFLKTLACISQKCKVIVEKGN